MKLFIFAIILLALNCTVFGQTPKAPSGWQFPNVKDYTGDWNTRRKDAKHPFKTQGDFNNDKIKDEAWILLPSDGAGAGLFVFLRRPNKTFRAVQLDYLEGDNAQTLYVDVAPKGEYDTACGKGFGNCAPENRQN